ncbi:MAG: hypothetical protein ACOXZH_07420, partial [Bacteroidales bacterium]
IETLADADKPIGLDKYQTKPTAITDDEVYAISYDKMSSVIERHRDAINDKKYAKAIHALAPSENKTLTPVIKTTGASVDAGTRKALTRSDVYCDEKEIRQNEGSCCRAYIGIMHRPRERFVGSRQKFAQQYYNYESGKITNMYSFEIYEFGDNPYFNASTLKKIAFGESTSGYLQGSVAFYAPRMMKADGTTKTYLSEAATDPQNQQNLVNFRTTLSVYL